jgi:hypothetical protein
MIVQVNSCENYTLLTNLTCSNSNSEEYGDITAWMQQYLLGFYPSLRARYYLTRIHRPNRRKTVRLYNFIVQV